MKNMIITTLKGVLFFLGWLLLCVWLPLPRSDNPAIWRFWAEVVPLLATSVLTVIFLRIEKKELTLKLFAKPLKGLGIGMIGGVFWLAAPVMILLLIGVLKLEGSNEVSFLTIWLLAAFINVVMQELLVRGYLYGMIKQKYNRIVSTVVTTALFTAMHGGALEAGIIPVLNVITMSLLMTTVLEYTGSLLAPIIMHFIWNGVGSIVLGEVSLADDYPHLLNISFSGSDILTGGFCKIEGSIIVLVINLFLICFFYWLLRRQQFAGGKRESLLLED